jgi:hypothetical protein
MTRAVVSVTPPGGNGTSSVIGRDGNVCADTVAGLKIKDEIATADTAAQKSFLMLPPCLMPLRVRSRHFRTKPA